MTTAEQRTLIRHFEIMCPPYSIARAYASLLLNRELIDDEWTWVHVTLFGHKS